MEKANKKVIYEKMIINKAFGDELKGYEDKEYDRYHMQNADWYRNFSDRINKIVGFTGTTNDEFINYVSSINLDSEQKRALFELRKEPMYKKVLGEASLKNKAELEKVLGSKITADGITFADEKNPRVAVKTEKELEQELDTYSDKLSQLLSSGAIKEEQYDNYERDLDYIYEYYISRSKGEQLPFRKMKNRDYEKIEERAQENGISYSEQSYKELDEMLEDFKEVQKLQEQGLRK